MNINQSQTEILRVKNEKVKGPASLVGSIMTKCRTGSQFTVHRRRWSWSDLIGQRVDCGTKHTVYDTGERLRHSWSTGADLVEMNH